jgi:lysophospholipase L1-like esterase
MSRSGSLTDKLELGLAIACFWLFFLLAMDVGFRAILRVADRFAAHDVSMIEDHRVDTAPFSDAHYDVKSFFAELRAARKEAYTPYVVWRSRRFAGDFIDIDAEGNRSTHHNSEASDPLRVWLFGGSVIWGLGAPDSETVSSHLARHFNNELGIDAEVRNLGEIGFVNTQEIVLLMRELQLGRRPDLVVFLDGANDAPAAVLWPEFDGNHMNFTDIRDRFEKRGKQELSPMLRILHRSGTWRMAEVLREKLVTRPIRQQAPPYSIPTDPAETVRRGNRAAEIWLANRRFVDALAARYEFTPFYLLQPSLKVGAKAQHPSEVAILASEMENDAKRVGMESYAAMREAVRRELGAESEPNLRTVDLSDLFADVSEPLYFDYVHVGHAGNRLIASGIADVLVRYLCSQPESAVPLRARRQLARACR